MKQKHIVYIQYTDPAAYPPLIQSSRILIQAGWSVTFIGIKQRDYKELDLDRRYAFNEHYLFEVQPGIRQKLHYAWFIVWSIGWVLRSRATHVYLSQPMAVPVGWVINHLLNLNMIYHEHDSPEVVEDSSQLSRFDRLLARLRKVLANAVTLNILPNELRAEAFKESTQTKQPVITIWNCPGRDEVAIEPSFSVHKTSLKLWYHGSIAQFRLPLTLIEALAKSDLDIQFSFAGYETGRWKGYVQKLITTAHKYGIENKVEYLGTIPRHRLFERCRESDIGIAFGSQSFSINTSEEYFVGATNKPFDYMACGLALLVSDGPAFRTVFAEAGYGRPCNPESVDSIVEALQWFYDNRTETENMARLGYQKIRDDWNYDTVFEKFFKYIDK